MKANKFNLESIKNNPIVKKWQSNGYYPVEKIIFNGSKCEVLHQKIINGSLQFVTNYCTYTTAELLYRLNNNGYIFASNENSSNFN